MRSDLRPVWASWPLSAWFGLVIGAANALCLALLVLLADFLPGSPLGMQVSARGWLITQVKTMALDVLAFIGFGALAGLCLALLLSAAALLRGKGRTTAAMERWYYCGFVLMALAVPAALALFYAWASTVYRPGHSPVPFLLTAAAAAAAMIGATSLFNRRLRRHADPEKLWLHAGAMIAAGSFFLLGLRGVVLAPANWRLAAGPVLIVGWGLVNWGLLRLMARLIARARRPSRWKSLALAVTGVAAVSLVFVYSGIYHGPPRAARADTPNVVMIVLDTVRADHVSAYGYARPTTPALDRMAGQGVLFSRAYATAPWTVPSHASFFTGLYPGIHHCTHEHLWLGQEFVTLAEIFRAKGYVTLAYSNNPVVGRMTNMDQGFDRFIEGWRPDMTAFLGASILQDLSWIFYPDLFPADAGAADTWRVVARWLADLKNNGSPFFMFINYMEAHPPMPRFSGAYSFFESPTEAVRRLAGVSRDFVARNAGMDQLTPEQRDTEVTLYDGEILYLDHELAKIRDLLGRLGLEADTVVIVLSDHGEMFDEHGGLWGHERTLYDRLLHVPLCMAAPGRLPAGKRVDLPVSLRELPAMIVALQEGRGLDGVLKATLGPDRAEIGGILAEVMRPLNFIKVVQGKFPGHDFSELDRRQKALIHYPWKLIWDSRGGDELYNLEDDPGETRNLINTSSDVYHDLSARIISYRQAHPDEGKGFAVPALDPATIEKLRALGYLP
ncbi:MAG TPA: sulfatase [bacterium]|nr:sulfatase [bacterium]